MSSRVSSPQRWTGKSKVTSYLGREGRTKDRRSDAIRVWPRRSRPVASGTNTWTNTYVRTYVHVYTHVWTQVCVVCVCHPFTSLLLLPNSKSLDTVSVVSTGDGGVMVEDEDGLERREGARVWGTCRKGSDGVPKPPPSTMTQCPKSEKGTTPVNVFWVYTTS